MNGVFFKREKKTDKKDKGALIRIIITTRSNDN